MIIFSNSDDEVTREIKEAYMARGEKEKREQEQLLRELQQQAQQRKQQMESINQS